MKGGFRVSVNINAHYDEIYRYCYFKIRNLHIAEDLTQETFLKFIKQNNYVNRDKPLAYLYTIAKNTCIDYLRKIEYVELSEEIIADNEFEKLEMQKVVRDAILSLTNEEREIVFLRYVNDLKIGDISKITGISRFAINRKLKKALDSLKLILREEDFFE